MRTAAYLLSFASVLSAAEPLVYPKAPRIEHIDESGLVSDYGSPENPEEFKALYTPIRRCTTSSRARNIHRR